MTRPTMSTRRASRKTADAADQLLDWLKQQGGVPDGSGHDQVDPGFPAGSGAEARSSDPPMPSVPAKCEAFAREDAPWRLAEPPEPEHDVDLGLTPTLFTLRSGWRR